MIEQKTKNNYLQRVKFLIRRFEREQSLIFEGHKNDFLVWLSGHASDLSPSTRRQYRASVTFYFDKFYDQQPSDNVVNFLCSENTRSQVRKRHGKRTSAKKAKNIKTEVLQELLSYLFKARSKSASLIANILIASSFFGLRPIEWGRAKLIFEEGFIEGLKVMNAKHTQGRSHGPDRVIWIDVETVTALSQNAKRAINAAKYLEDYFKQVKTSHLKTPDIKGLNEKEIEASYLREVENRLEKARQYLNQLYRTNPYLNKLAKKSRITLYSARHQFAADAKKAGLSPVEIAALMGHASIRTNQASYGKRRCGNPGGFGVAADQENIERVEARMPEMTQDDTFNGPSF